MNFSITTAWSQFTQYAGRMDQQTWLLVCAAGIFVGFLCLRGFGSRNSY